MTAASISTPATVREGVETRCAQQPALMALITLAEQRDSDTESHILRVQNYVRILAQKLMGQPAFADVISPTFIEILCACAPLYDMGTLGIPDRILLKPGRLTPAELAIMRTHPSVGYEALVRAEKIGGNSSRSLAITKELVYCHQEKWDGSGYPRGLAGPQIPVSARIIAIADVYDALISNKVYKDGVSHDRAVQVIFGERGGHFDPDMADAFIEIQDEFDAIAQRYADTEDDMQRKIETMANAIAEQTEM
ncbi:MAG: HD domain-containing protein [Rhodoferax sp.]|nr:HD domain-containing protein [Rhodoferax sp.]